ncbi:MAG: amidase, partial [Chloroflexi bacterium]|nr:amidase [Chloroflexota bacterium]
EDVAILLQIIAGYDADDPASKPTPEIGDWKLEVGGLRFRVGVPDQAFFGDMDSEIEAAVRAAIKTIGDLGCELREVSLAGHGAATEVSRVIQMAEAAAFHRDRLRDHPEAYGADVLTRFRSGAEITGMDYALARRAQAEWRRKMTRLFETIDLLVLPATPLPAPLIAESDAVKLGTSGLTRLTRLFNFTGNPAIVLPCGFTASGLPIGLQIAGPTWGEAQVLALAHAFEQSTEWRKRRPVRLTD